MPESLNLAPAQWIWWPSQRTLPNTFVLFRKQLEVREGLRRATGWLAADSRYRLFVNGQRIQWGPAISDPRFAEADPLDLTEMLCSGANTLGVEVLYYGHGDGTWPGGKPGLLVRLELEYSDGTTELVATDESWLARVDRAHPPAQPKRWYLRALQEEFDARLHPAGWTLPNYQPDAEWLPAMPLTLAPDKPPLASGYWDYLRDWSIPPEACQLLARQVPLLQEDAFILATLRQQGRLRWLRSPDDWFDFRTPDSFTLSCEQVVTEIEPGCYELPAQPADEGVVLVFELSVQSVGWPVFELEAPAGAICELMTQESHDPEGSPWLDTHFFAWSRFLCAEGVNRFEAFEFESFKWLALHIHGATGPVKLREVGLRLRRFPWPNEPKVEVSEPPLQSLFEANVNTLHNCCFDLITDGVGRERQPYSGDAAHSLEALRYTFGETSLPARFLFHYSKGLTPHGYLLDCWPAYDRLERISAKQIGAAFWGPILDHTVQFGFDCWQHWQYSGDLEAVAHGYPALVAFLGYLETSVGSDGLLPVENLGEPYVYLDHQAYRLQRHKQCPYNLYAAAMLKRALAPLATALGEVEVADRATRLGQSLEATTVARFWDPETALFVLNLPWLAEEEGPRLCDRSLANALLFDQCPDGEVELALTRWRPARRSLAGVIHPMRSGRCSRKPGTGSCPPCWRPCAVGGQRWIRSR